MALFYAAVWRDLVPLLRITFYSHVQVFMCEMSSVCCLKYSYSYFYFHSYRQGFVLIIFAQNMTQGQFLSGV